MFLPLSLIVPPPGCGNPGTPRNGRRLGNNFTVGAVVFFRCFDDFDIVESKFRICQANGSWSGTQPVCQPFNSEYIRRPNSGLLSKLVSLSQQNSHTNTGRFGPQTFVMIFVRAKIITADEGLRTETSCICTKFRFVPRSDQALFNFTHDLGMRITRICIAANLCEVYMVDDFTMCVYYH